MRWLVLLCLAATADAGEVWFGRIGIVEEFSREVRRGKELTVRGSTRGGYKNAELIIIAPNGRTFRNKDNKVSEYNFAFIVRFEDGAGAYRMEIVASAPNSVRSIGRFTVWHGKRKPKVNPYPPPAEGAPTPRHIHVRLIETRWLARLNAFRARFKLRPARWNEAVSARCREHARRMAQARRRIHKFQPYGGVLDMLRRNGAGKNPRSGSDAAWLRVTTVRPFPRPAPQPPGPRVRNHVVTFVQSDSPKLIKVSVSLERLFIESYEREPASRLLALDPNLVEMGIGIARPTKKDGLRRDSLYYSIAFVQVNDRTIIREQDGLYDELLKEARDREPALLRDIARWRRGGKAISLFRAALKDRRPEVAGAAFDALLLQDEAKAQAIFAKAVKPAAGALAKGRYADAVRLWKPYAESTYDRSIREAAQAVLADAAKAAALELKSALDAPEPDRTERLKALRKRVRGLAIEAQVKAALG